MTAMNDNNNNNWHKQTRSKSWERPKRARAYGNNIIEDLIRLKVRVPLLLFC